MEVGVAIARQKEWHSGEWKEVTLALLEGSVKSTRTLFV